MFFFKCFMAQNLHITFRLTCIVCLMKWCLIIDIYLISDFEEAQQQQQKMLQQQQPMKSNGNNGDWNKKVL